MLLHLYSSHTLPVGLPKKDDGRRTMPNGHVRLPDAAERQAQDAEEFELEGLMSDDEEPKQGNGHAR